MTSERSQSEVVQPVAFTYGTETGSPRYCVLDPSTAETEDGQVDVVAYEKWVSDTEAIGRGRPPHSYTLQGTHHVTQAGGGPLPGVLVDPATVPLNREVLGAGRNINPLEADAIAAFMELAGIKTCADVLRIGVLGVAVANSVLDRDSQTSHRCLSSWEIGRIIGIVRRFTGQSVPFRPQDDAKS